MDREKVRSMGLLGIGCALALVFAPGPAYGETPDDPPPSGSAPRAAGQTTQIDNSTWVDHDHEPIRRPSDWEPNFWGLQFRQGVAQPLSHAFDIPDKLLWVARLFGAETRREAVNVNAFDEAPNSEWFTNRNHRRAVPIAELKRGPYPTLAPAKPWIIKHAKTGGWSAGFQIKDADGKKWLVK
ncbi:MAG TPA: hypothetical protein VI198_00790, partial [Candidatus Eisenbacteria bacterium]